MTDRVKSLSTIHPDFDYIVAQLGNYLSMRPVWKDQLRSSTGQFTLEVAAAIGELDQYAIERLMQDAFPESAKLDSAVYAAMKTLGTRITRKRPGVTKLPLAQTSDPNGPPIGLTRLRRTSSSGAVIIPALTQFSTSLGLMFNRRTIRFDPGSFFAYQVSEDTLNKEAIELFEGRVETRYFNMSGEDFASIFSGEDNFTVSDSDVSISLGSGGITIGNIPRQTIGLWNNKNNAPGWQDITTSDGRLHVLFGSSVYGTIPGSNQLATMKYVITKGGNGNGVFPTYRISCDAFPGLDAAYDVFVSVPSLTGPPDNSATTIAGGVNETPAALYKKLGSQLAASEQGNKAIQQQDYTAVLSVFAGVEDALVIPQRDLDPSDLRFMNVAKIVTYPKNMNQAAFQQLLTYLNARSMMSMNFYREEVPGGDALEPNIRSLPLRMNVYCSQNADLIGIRDNYITPAILGLIDREWLASAPMPSTASKLNRKITISDLTTTVKNAHPNIDYVALLDPTVDVLAKITAPVPNLLELAGGATFSTPRQFYSVTIVTATGESLPSPPVSIFLTSLTNSVLLSVRAPSNYNNSWTRLNVYRGDTIDNMVLVNPVGVVWSYVDDTATFIDTNAPDVPGMFKPTRDTTGEWVINLPNTWSPDTSIAMFNSERPSRQQGN